MAITNSDGSIILTTKVEDSGLKRGMEKIISEQKEKLQSLTREYAKLITNNQQNTEEAKKLKKEIDNLSKSIKQNENILKSFGKSSSEALEQTSEAVENSSKSFSKFQSALKSIARYLALAFSVTKIIQFSNEAGQLATQTEASVQRLVDIYGSASDSVGDFIDANARALGMSKAAAASFSSVYGNLFSVWADQSTNAELTNRYLNMTAVVASKTGRTVEDVQERVRSGLLGNTEAIEDLGIFVNVKTIEMTDAFQRMANGKSWEQLDAYTQQQIRSIAILEQATAKYGDEVANTSAATRARYQAAYQDFQNSWGTVVSQILLPVLEYLTKIFDIATKGLNTLSGRSGEILENVESVTDNSAETVENIEEQVDAQKELNKELKKTMASFDTVEILSSQTSENTEESGVGGLQGVLGGGTLDGSAIVAEVDDTLAEIMGIVGFSLAAIGIILLCFGQISWGIGFILAGAAMFTVSYAALSDVVSSKVRNELNTIIAIASGALLAIGIILILSGVGIPLGIGLIISGVAGLAGVVAVNWDTIKNNVINIFNTIVDWVKTYGLLVLGIILCLTGGGIAPGIALIIKWAEDGAVQGVPLATTILDKVKEIWGKVKEFWDSNIAKYFTAQWWADLGKQMINGLIKTVVDGLNKLIDKINSFGFDLPDILGGGHIGFNISPISIPKLAQGAVIPPNREFLAVLGDQKHGTNIEAPLQTIVDAFNIALAQNSGVGGNTEVILEVDGREFGRAVVEQGNRENRRIGTRLVIA